MLYYIFKNMLYLYVVALLYYIATIIMVLHHTGILYNFEFYVATVKSLTVVLYL